MPPVASQCHQLPAASFYFLVNPSPPATSQSRARPSSRLLLLSSTTELGEVFFLTAPPLTRPLLLGQTASPQADCRLKEDCNNMGFWASACDGRMAIWCFEDLLQQGVSCGYSCLIVTMTACIKIMVEDRATWSIGQDWK